MTKQEIIREGIKEHLLNCFEAKGCRGGFYNNFADSFSKSLPILLDGLDVVIKDRRFGMGVDTRGGYNWKDVFFVIPLIKEESDGDNEVS